MNLFASKLSWLALLVGVLLLAGCGLSEQDAQRLVDQRIAQALTAAPTLTPPPTATPQPAPTPQPTATPAHTATPQPTSTPLPQAALAKLFPTPTPLAVRPTATPSVPAAAGPVVASAQSINLGDGLTLLVDPAQPYSGRSVSFHLSGLSPWQRFTATFIDPFNSPADWTEQDQTFIKDSSGKLIKTYTMYADAQGRAAWTRSNVLDAEGQWTVQIAASNKTYNGRYFLVPAQMQTTTYSEMGIAMRRFSGSASEVYLSSGVPVTLALDLSGLIVPLTEELKPWTGLSSTQLPSVYLFANDDLFRQALRATGSASVNPFVSGIYRSSGKYRGIYVTLDEFSAPTIQIAVHEYVHLLVDESAPTTADLPAWLNEGLATYLENHVSPKFGAGTSAQREAYSRAAEAKAAQAGGGLIPLSRLVSQQDWNNQADGQLLRLQYSQAYMAVRYLTERFGDGAAALIIKDIERSRSFEASFRSVTGLGTVEFERDWIAWLKAWKDPEQEAARQYIAQTELVLAGVDRLSSDRAAFLNSAAGSGPLSQRVASQSQLVSRSTQLVSQGAAIAPPDQLRDAHGELLLLLNAVRAWLQRELDGYTSSSNSLLNQANAMIPEINAREFMVRRQVNSASFNYGLE